MNRAKQRRHTAAGDAVRAQAAEHLLRAQGAGLHPDHDLALEAWRREDAAHDAAFRNVSRTWETAAHLKESPAYDELLGTPTLREQLVGFWRQLSEYRPQLSPSPGWAFASVLAVMVMAGAWLLTPLGEDRTVQYATQVAEIRDVPLDDGSVVTLGARSALDVEFTEARRTVRLAGGEAFFSVSKDVERPFLVLAGDTRIRVVGTKFNVNYDGDRVRVSVLEGVVEVIHADGSSERVAGGGGTPSAIKLVAGQQVVAADAAPLPAAEPLRGIEPGAWREGRLNYQDAPLSEIIADANRYRTAEIRIVSSALGRERLTTSFRTSQIDQMLATLPDSLPLIVERNADGTVELRSNGRGGG